MAAASGAIIRHANELAYAVEPIRAKPALRATLHATVVYVGSDPAGKDQRGVVTRIGDTFASIAWDAGHESIARLSDLRVVWDYTPVAWSPKFRLWMRAE